MGNPGRRTDEQPHSEFKSGWMKVPYDHWSWMTCHIVVESHFGIFIFILFYFVLFYYSHIFFIFYVSFFNSYHYFLRSLSEVILMVVLVH